MSLVTAGYWTLWTLLFTGSLYGILHYALIVPRRERRLSELVEIVTHPSRELWAPCDWVER